MTTTPASLEAELRYFYKATKNRYTETEFVKVAASFILDAVDDKEMLGSAYTIFYGAEKQS